MISKEKANCPDCGCSIESRATICCDSCAESRRMLIKLRENIPVGCQSSPEQFEASNIGGGDSNAGARSREHVRNVLGLRDDVKWRRGKHGS